MTSYKKFSPRNWDKKSQINHTLLNCALLTILLLTAVVYLAQTNTTIFYSIKIKEINQKLQTLKIENERLVKELAQLNSMTNIYKISADNKMIKIAKIDYLIPVQETLAVK